MRIGPEMVELERSEKALHSYISRDEDNQPIDRIRETSETTLRRNGLGQWNSRSQCWLSGPIVFAWLVRQKKR